MVKWAVVTAALSLIALTLFVTATLSPASGREPLIVYGSLSALMAAVLSFFLVTARRRTSGGKDMGKPSQPSRPGE